MIILKLRDQLEGTLEFTRLLQDANRIGDVGAHYMGMGLKVNSSLKRLYLVRNKALLLMVLFALVGCCEKAGRRTAALTRVLQDNNSIGDGGACGLGEGLKVNSSLMIISMVLIVYYCVLFTGAMRLRKH